MNRIWMFLLLTTVLACGKKNEDGTTSESTADSLAFQKDTVHVNEVPLIHHTQNDQRHSITLHGDTVIKFEDYHRELDYIDINEDGYKDIRVEVTGNTPNQCDNYLFDKDAKIFRKIENCDMDITKIKDAPYYYSIARAGCASENVESYLSRIENWTQLYMGKILIKDCNEKSTDGIHIYKVSVKGEELVEKLPLKKFDDADNSKPAYLKEYWAVNYKKFE